MIGHLQWFIACYDHAFGVNVLYYSLSYREFCQLSDDIKIIILVYKVEELLCATGVNDGTALRFA